MAALGPRVREQHSHAVEVAGRRPGRAGPGIDVDHARRRGGPRRPPRRAWPPGSAGGPRPRRRRRPAGRSRGRGSRRRRDTDVEDATRVATERHPQHGTEGPSPSRGSPSRGPSSSIVRCLAADIRPRAGRRACVRSPAIGVAARRPSGRVARIGRRRRAPASSPAIAGSVVAVRRVAGRLGLRSARWRPRRRRRRRHRVADAVPADRPVLASSRRRPARPSPLVADRSVRPSASASGSAARRRRRRCRRPRPPPGAGQAGPHLQAARQMPIGTIARHIHWAPVSPATRSSLTRRVAAEPLDRRRRAGRCRRGCRAWARGGSARPAPDEHQGGEHLVERRVEERQRRSRWNARAGPSVVSRRDGSRGTSTARRTGWRGRSRTRRPKCSPTA